MRGAVCHPSRPISTPATQPDEMEQDAPAAPGGARRRGLSRLTLLGLLISALAVAGVVYWALQQEPPQFPDTAREWGALVAAVLLYAIATLVRGERWHSLLRAEGAHPHRADSHGLNVVGYAANNIFPARAGDAVRVFLMAPRAETSKKTVIGTLLAERLLDVAVILILFVVVANGVIGDAGDAGWIMLATALMTIAGVVAVVLIRRNPRLHAIAAPILSSTLQRRGRHGMTLLGMTFVIWGLEAGVWMSTGAAAGFDMNPIEGCYLVALASLFALIPSGPGYAGTQDAAAITGIRALGGTKSQALTYLILVRFVLTVPITIAGLTLMAVRYGGIRRLRRVA
jgi:uncharacterized membrane protein YbhN (UPF0104 family)